MVAGGLRGDDDAPARDLGHVIAQGLGYRIEGQRSIDEPLDKFQTAHLLLPVGADRPVALAGDVHHGNIVDRPALVSRFSDPVIFGRISPAKRWL
jgi:hypothetical protein